MLNISAGSSQKLPAILLQNIETAIDSRGNVTIHGTATPHSCKHDEALSKTAPP